MKCRTAQIFTAVSVTFLLTLGSPSVFAQGAAGGGAGGAGAGASAGAAGSNGSSGSGASGAANTRSSSGQAGNTSAGGQSGGNWSTANVTANDPFGTINVNAAGTTQDSIRSWAQGRSAAERTELMGRCGVISEQGNAQRYPAHAQQFCRNFMASAEQRGGTSGGSTTR